MAEPVGRVFVFEFLVPFVHSLTGLFLVQPVGRRRGGIVGTSPFVFDAEQETKCVAEKPWASPSEGSIKPAKVLFLQQVKIMALRLFPAGCSITEEYFVRRSFAISAISLDDRTLADRGVI